jgi:uncharacterized protein YgfB (UPF0149 family)
METSISPPQISLSIPELQFLPMPKDMQEEEQGQQVQDLEQVLVVGVEEEQDTEEKEEMDMMALEVLLTVL